MPEKIAVCIAGLGRAGHFHLRSVQSSEQFSLKYIVDPAISANEFPGGQQTKVLPTLEEALSDPELDAVIVSTPTPHHYKHITQSLKAEKHVFAEKPLGTTAQEIQQCFALAEEKKLALHLGFQRRCDQNFRALKESIQEIGPVRTIKTSSRDNPQPSLDYLYISGNIFHDMLIHDFDMLIYLLGVRVPESVYAIGYAYDQEIDDLPDFDTVLVTLKYPDGLMCAIDTSRMAVYGYDQRIELFGEKGMALVENQRNDTVQVHTEAGMRQSPIQHSFPQRYKDAYAQEIAVFGQGVRNQQPYNVTKEECLLSHIIADAAHQSAITNSVVNVAEMYNSCF